MKINSSKNLSKIVILFCISILSLIHNPEKASANTDWDGTYNAAFDFKMSRASVCPKILPIEIEVIVTNGEAEGFIFNNGGGNKHKFCKLYHNGTISGKVDKNGKVKFKIKQKDSHSREYSSHRISGEIEGRLKLTSRSAKYHPSHKFEFSKVSSTNVKKIDEDKAAKEKAEKEKLAKEKAEKEKLAKEKKLAKDKAAKDKAAKDKAVKDKAAKDKAAKDKAAKEKKLAKDKVPKDLNLDKITSIEEAQTTVNNIQSTINMYITINDVMAKQKGDKKETYQEIIEKKITKLQKQKQVLQALLTSRFSTPIKPNNANLKVSAFRSAETFPKIPFYIPGTNEIGEMLVIPRVSDEGYLLYKLDFLDPTSEYDKVRDSISVLHKNIEEIITGLQKINEWTIVAQDNQVNRRISKTSICVPSNACETKKEGLTSTEIVFQVYEDGSTSGRIQRNKGLFSVGYNLSVESTILMSSYLIYMKDVGAKEFKSGSMSDEQVESLFN